MLDSEDYHIEAIVLNIHMWEVKKIFLYYEFVRVFPANHLTNVLFFFLNC